MTSCNLPDEWKGNVFKSLSCSYCETPILQLLEDTMPMVSGYNLHTEKLQAWDWWWVQCTFMPVESERSFAYPCIVDAGVQVYGRTHLGSVCISVVWSISDLHLPFPALCMTPCNEDIAWTLLQWTLPRIPQRFRVLQDEEEKSQSDLRTVSEITIILTTAALQSSRETRNPRIPSQVSHGWLFLGNVGWFTFISTWDKVLPAPRITQSLLNTKYSEIFQMPKGSAWITNIFPYEAQLTHLEMCWQNALSIQYPLDARKKILYEESSICHFILFTFNAAMDTFQTAEDPNWRPAPPLYPKICGFAHGHLSIYC